MQKLLILNLVLTAALTAGVVRLHNDGIHFEATHQAGAVQPQKETSPALALTSAPGPAAPGDWTEIPTRNPFSFDRTDIAIVAPQAPPPPPKPVGPKPVLFGTMSFGKEWLAMVASGQPGNRSARRMKTGEAIDGWTIVQILDKSIVIEGNSIRDSVIMNDPSAQVVRDHTRTLAPTAQAPVISVAAPAPPAPAASSSQPAQGRGQAPRRVIQMTPFGPREVEEPPK